MKRTAIFLALLVALLKFTQAQPALGILNDSVTIMPDTVLFNQQVTISFGVVNTGNQEFVGTLSIYYSVNNNFLNQLDTFNSQVVIDTGQVFQVVDSGYTILQPLFEVGDNIVVIWPVAMNAITTDSATAHIYVDTLLGIGSPNIKEQVKAFYNSHDQRVVIDYGNLISQIEEVTAYSILGEQITKYSYAVNEISFAEDSPEIVLLKISTKQGETISFKILRM
jgi:hypothetical protein